MVLVLVNIPVVSNNPGWDVPAAAHLWAVGANEKVLCALLTAKFDSAGH